MPRPAPSPITIAAIKALPEAAEGERTWVNGVITATVLDIKPFPNKEASIVQLKDSTGEIQANFWGRLSSNMESYRGTTIKITGQGISRGSRVWQGRTSVSLNVPDKAAIQIVGDYSPSQSAPTQGRAVSVQSGPPPAKLPVRNRVHAYFNILAEVHAQRQNRSDLPDITPSDEKDIATHISMTYDNRENYQEPLFKKPEPPKPEPKPEPEEGLYGGGEDFDEIPFLSFAKNLGYPAF